MDKKLKGALREAFAAPQPERKRAFLHSLPPQPISSTAFFCAQIRYISKWSWVVQSLIFVLTLIWAGNGNEELLWIVSSFMPLLAVTVVTESGRSEQYGMAEFELSSRFSLKSVLLARMGILGITDFLLLCIVLPFALWYRQYSVLRMGLFLLCPYLLTTFFGFTAVRRVRGKEASYLCMGIAAAVSAGNGILHQTVPMFYGEDFLAWWAAALLVFGIGTVKEGYRMVQQAEELIF